MSSQNYEDTNIRALVQQYKHLWEAEVKTGKKIYLKQLANKIKANYPLKEVRDIVKFISGIGGFIDGSGLTYLGRQGDLFDEYFNEQTTLF